MPKPPPKGDDIEAHLAVGRAHAIRATTMALAANSTMAWPKTIPPLSFITVAEMVSLSSLSYSV